LLGLYVNNLIQFNIVGIEIFLVLLKQRFVQPSWVV